MKEEGKDRRDLAWQKQEERVEREGEKSLKSRTSQGHFHLRYPVWNLSFLSRRHFNTYIYIYIHTRETFITHVTHFSRGKSSRVKKNFKQDSDREIFRATKFLKNLIIHSFIVLYICGNKILDT